MVIRDDVKLVLHGAAICRYNLFVESRFPDSVLFRSIPLRFGSSLLVKCKFCPYPNYNWCLNCGEPHCMIHGYLTMNYIFLNTLCLDCRNECLNDQKHLNNVGRI